MFYKYPDNLRTDVPVVPIILNHLRAKVARQNVAQFFVRGFNRILATKISTTGNLISSGCAIFRLLLTSFSLAFSLAFSRATYSACWSISIAYTFLAPSFTAANANMSDPQP